MTKVDAVLLNPTARGGVGGQLWERFLASEEAREQGFDQAEIFKADGEDERERLILTRNWAERSVQKGFRNFVAVGGDGTVNLAINALKGLPIRLGAVGLGSSNDFHKPFSSKKRVQISDLWCRINFDEAFPHDLVEAEFSSSSGLESRLFAVNSSIGLTAEANYYFNTAGPFFQRMKGISVDSAVFFAALLSFLKYRRFSINFQFGDLPLDQIDLVNLGVVKIPFFAGGLHYDQNPLPNSGVFGVHGCKNMPRWRILKTFSALMQGRFSGLPDTFSLHGKHLAISSESSFALEMDGEVMRVLQAKFKILPREMALCP